MDGRRAPHLDRWRAAPCAALLLLVACRPSWSERLPAQASPNAKLYATECDAGEPASCFALGLLYELGESTGHGVPSNATLATELITKACEADHALACEHLARETNDAPPTEAETETP